MKKLILILFVCALAGSGFSQVDSTQHHARELLEVTGSGNLGVKMMHNIFSSFKNEFPRVPSEFWEELSKEISGKELIELVIPIYSKYYTDEELIKLIEFYRSPLGQKVVQKLPLISQDSYVVGQEWGKKMGEKVITRLKERGLFKEN
jgi:hypothetical protein